VLKAEFFCFKCQETRKILVCGFLLVGRPQILKLNQSYKELVSCLLPQTEKPQEPKQEKKAPEEKSKEFWKDALKWCYFLLLALAAIAIFLFASQVDVAARSIIAVVIIIVGVIGYASFQAFDLASKLTRAIYPADLKTLTKDAKEAEKKSRLKSNQIVSLVTIIVVVAFAVASAILNDVFATAVLVGAIGGLVHELVSSNGKYILPNIDSTSGNPSDVSLGGLYGLVIGGVAGLLLVGGLAATTVTAQVLSSAFLAGLAVKGVSDAAAGNAVATKTTS
jgi:hypothetical protein